MSEFKDYFKVDTMYHIDAKDGEYYLGDVLFVGDESIIFKDGFGNKHIIRYEYIWFASED